jgi:glycine/D-amino acid oxidase-like deaminating enzyme
VAREVLLATNGYTTQLVPRARQGIFPAGSYIICTEPLSLELQNDVSPRGRMFFDSLNFLNYFRLTPDGRMLFGGRHNLSTSLDVYESARSLRERMVEVFPQLAAAKVTHSWTGKLGLTFDLMPHIGQADGVWYAMGYCGHGVAVASKLGREAAQIIAGERASSLFREISHMRTPVTHLDRYYLPFVSAWYRMMDKVQ